MIPPQFVTMSRDGKIGRCSMCRRVGAVYAIKPFVLECHVMCKERAMRYLVRSMQIYPRDIPNLIEYLDFYERYEAEDIEPHFNY